MIPFTAEVEQGIAARHRVALRVEDTQLPVTQMLSMNQSPDGRRVTFGAVAHIWMPTWAARRAVSPTSRNGSISPRFRPMVSGSAT